MKKRQDRVANILAWHGCGEFTNFNNLITIVYGFRKFLKKAKKNAASVMAWVFVSKRGKLPLVFDDKRCKNQKKLYPKLQRLFQTNIKYFNRMVV